MIHPHTMLADYGPGLGKGVYATQPIACGTLTYVQDSLDIVLSPSQWEALPPLLQEQADTYSWCDARGNRVLGWDLSKHVNHSCEANTMRTAYGCEVAIRDIKAGEAITAEYGLLRILYEYPVQCGCKECRGKVSPHDFAQYGAQWDLTVKKALRLASQVPQALWGALPAHRQAELQKYWQDESHYVSLLNEQP